jgi:uncharacterized protein YjbI with pentapeptide repeats
MGQKFLWLNGPRLHYGTPALRVGGTKVLDFRRRTLSDLSLPRSGWRGVELTEANLSGSTPAFANLNGVEFVRAQLGRADVHGADFRNGALNGANMSAAKFPGTIVTSVWLRARKYRDTNFTGVQHALDTGG